MEYYPEYRVHGDTPAERVGIYIAGGDIPANSHLTGIFEVLGSEQYNIIGTNGTNNIILKNNRALHGDTVSYVLEESGAVVQNVCSRKITTLSGTLLAGQTRIIGFTRKRLPIYTFIPANWQYPPFYVASATTSKTNLYASIKFSEWKTTQLNPHGILVEIFGSVDDEEAGVQMLLRKHQIFTKSYSKITSPTNSDSSNRIDLSDAPVVSIDPEGCRDIDDAFHLSEDGDIYVHIADVDAEFPRDGLYENELLKRLTSIYTPRKTYHMLPETYATNTCSLLPNTVRRALSAKFVFENGQICRREFLLTNIVNKKALTYEEADKMFGSPSAIMLDNICELLAVSKNSHALVERLMIMTNQFAAEYIEGMFCRTHCLTMPCDNGNVVRNPQLDRYLRFRHERQATYETKDSTMNDQDLRHDGLGLRLYTHFTSPIRRYADIIVHRMVKDRILKKEHQCSNLQEITQRLNNYQRQVKKFYRELNLLTLISKVNDDGGTLNTYGYPIEYKNGKIHVYLPEFNMEYKYPLETDIPTLYVSAGIVGVSPPTPTNIVLQSRNDVYRLSQKLIMRVMSSQ